MSLNRMYFLLGLSVTVLSVMLFKQLQIKPEVVRTRTETIINTVNMPFQNNFEFEANNIRSSLNKSKLKHILIYINALCNEYDVTYETVKAVIQTESDWNHRAISKSGAVGLMQILPKTARDVFKTPRSELFDPYVNVTIGIKYLSQLNKQFDDLDGVLTAYSHGPTVTKKYSDNYIKTNFYVKRVHNNM